MVVKNFINKIKHGGAALPKIPKLGFKQRVSRVFMTNAQKKVANTTVSQKKIDKYTTIATQKQGAIDALKTRLDEKQKIFDERTAKRTATNATEPLNPKQLQKSLKTDENKTKSIAAIQAQITAKEGRMKTRFAPRFAKINAQIARKLALTGVNSQAAVSEPKLLNGNKKVTATTVTEQLEAASKRLKTIHNNNVQKKINASEAAKKSKVNIAQRQVNAEKNFQTRKLAPFDTKIAQLEASKTAKLKTITELDNEIRALKKTDTNYNERKKELSTSYKKAYDEFTKDSTELISTTKKRDKVSAYYQRFVNQASQRVRREESTINTKRPLTLNQLKEKVANDTALGFSGRMLRDFKAASLPPQIQQRDTFISTQTLLKKGETITANNFTKRRPYVAAYISRLTEKTRPEKLTAIELEIEKLTNLYPPGTSKIKLAIDELSGTKRKRNKRIDLLEEKRKRFLKAVDKLTSLKKLNKTALTKIAQQVSNTVAAAGVPEKLASTVASTASTEPATPTAVVQAPGPLRFVPGTTGPTGPSATLRRPKAATTTPTTTANTINQDAIKAVQKAISEPAAAESLILLTQKAKKKTEDAKEQFKLVKVQLQNASNNVKTKFNKLKAAEADVGTTELEKAKAKTEYVRAIEYKKTLDKYVKNNSIEVKKAIQRENAIKSAISTLQKTPTASAIPTTTATTTPTTTATTATTAPTTTATKTPTTTATTAKETKPLTPRQIEFSNLSLQDQYRAREQALFERGNSLNGGPPKSLAELVADYKKREPLLAELAQKFRVQTQAALNTSLLNLKNAQSNLNTAQKTNNANAIQKATDNLNKAKNAVNNAQTRFNASSRESKARAAALAPTPSEAAAAIAAEQGIQGPLKKNAARNTPEPPQKQSL